MAHHDDIPSHEDVQRIRAALQPVQHAARGLPWAKKRPWTVDTHVGVEQEVPVIDLHDLGTRQAEQLVDALIQIAPELATGSAFLITGRGRHSTTRAVLPEVVRRRLGAACQQHGWRLRVPRAGRFVLIVDPTLAPSAATGALGWGFWAWMIFVAAAAALTLYRATAG